MKKLFLAMGLAACALVGCGDSSSAASAEPDNDKPVALENSSSSDESGSGGVWIKSSSSVKPESTEKNSSSSEKSESSSSKNVPVTEECSSSVASESSSSVASESSSSEEFDWSVPKEAYFNPNIEYGTMTDERDGKVYRTVKIGDQTWMAENLNYADSVKTPSLKGRSMCYKNESKNCDVAGRYYTWAAAIDSVKLYEDYSIDCGYDKTCTLPDTVYGICPSGWHLPSSAEWMTLFVAAGGKKFLTYEDKYTSGPALKSVTGWLTDCKTFDSACGTNSTGFSALPTGVGFFFIASPIYIFMYVGHEALFWSADEVDSEEAIYMELNDLFESVELEHIFDKEYGVSVRCLKN